MTMQTELGLLLAVARCELHRMSANAPESLEGAIADLRAATRIHEVLTRIIDTCSYTTQDADALGAAHEAAAHGRDNAKFRGDMMRHRDTLETRVERYLGDV